MRQCCFIGKSSSKMLPLKCPVVESAANVQTERYYSCCAFHFVRRQTHGERGYPLYSLGSTVQEQIILTQIVVWEMEKKAYAIHNPDAPSVRINERGKRKKALVMRGVSAGRRDDYITSRRITSSTVGHNTIPCCSAESQPYCALFGQTDTPTPRVTVTITIVLPHPGLAKEWIMCTEWTTTTWQINDMKWYKNKTQRADVQRDMSVKKFCAFRLSCVHCVQYLELLCTLDKLDTVDIQWIYIWILFVSLKIYNVSVGNNHGKI